MISKYYAHEVRSFNMFDFLIGKYKQFVADRIDLSVSSEKKKNEYSFYMSLTGIIMGLLASVRIIFQVFSGIIPFQAEYHVIAVLCRKNAVVTGFSLSTISSSWRKETSTSRICLPLLMNPNLNQARMAIYI